MNITIIHHTSVLYYGEYASCSSRPSPTSVGRVAIEDKSGISHKLCIIFSVLIYMKSRSYLTFSFSLQKRPVYIFAFGEYNSKQVNKEMLNAWNYLPNTNIHIFRSFVKYSPIFIVWLYPTIFLYSNDTEYFMKTVPLAFCVTVE